MSELKKYIHYGSRSFHPEWFNSIKNTTWNKPYGGLWASPYPAPNIDWKQWCIDNEFDGRTSQSFIFSIDDTSNIIRLSDLKSVRKFKKSKYCNPWYHNTSCYFMDFIDFEAIVKDGFDGIEVLISSSDVYMAMYSWDVDSLLVFNPEIILVEERMLHG